jgi:DNA primase
VSLSNVHLTPQLVQAVRDAVDILDVAAAHTRLSKKGNRHVGLCPFHKEKTPSFSVDPSQGLYYCFGCGAGGDAIRLHMLTSGDDFPGAIESLARLYGIPLPSRSNRWGPEEPDLEAVLTAAEEAFREQLSSQPKPQRYLESRRIPPEVIERFRVGYAPPSFDFLRDRLSATFTTKEIEAAGLVSVKEEGGRRKAWDRFRDRLMFPIRNASGRLVGFGGRTLGDDRAKYINTAETDRFRKRYLLYGLDQARRAIREEGSALLVEGYFDVLAAVASGIEWTVASMGTALSEDQTRLCSRYAEEVVLGYDGDRAGHEACRRALPQLLARGLGVRRMVMEEGADPDSVRMEAGEEEVRRRVGEARDFVESEIDRLLPTKEPDARARSAAAAAIRELLSPIEDGVLRYAYGERAADRLGIPLDLLWQRRERAPSHPRPEPEQPAAPLREVTTLEERTLQLLLSGELELPAVEALPPQEVFLDAICGNIYGKFLGFYAEGGVPPQSGAILGQLTEQGEILDRVARILLEGPSCSGKFGELEESLRRLMRRWQQNRLKALAREINEAQRSGDGPRLEALIEEKSTLSRTLHEVDPRL